MSQDQIDPYAPPQTAVENLKHRRVDGVDAYTDAGLLIITEAYEFPQMCPKTGKESDLVSSKIKIPRVLKWGERPLWVSLLNVIPLMAFVFVFIAATSENYVLKLSHWWVLVSLVVMVALSYLTQRRMVQAHYFPGYFDASYLKTYKVASKILRVVMPLTSLAFVALSLYMVNEDREITGVVMIFCVLFFVLSMLNIKYGIHFVVKKYEGGCLYLKGAHPNFLAKLPSLPLSIPEKE